MDELTSVMKDFALTEGMDVHEFLREVDKDNDGRTLNPNPLTLNPKP